MEIEIRTIERKYEALRIHDPGRISRLTASIHQHGQLTPALVIALPSGGHLLIDGYARLAALEALARDVIEALVLPLGEAEALIQSHRFEATRRRSALEEGWLVAELVQVHGRSQAELALRLQRSVSWVSRRLALVRVLPASVQAAVQRAQIPPQAAMRVLVPLARAKAAHCERLVEQLEGRKASVRQMEALYLGYKQGDAQQRQRLVDHPWLYLKAREETQRAETLAEAGEGARLIHDLEVVVAVARRVRSQFQDGAGRRIRRGQRPMLEALGREAEMIVTFLRRQMEEEWSDVGSGHAHGDPSPAATGTWGPDHRADLGSLQELGQTSSA